LQHCWCRYWKRLSLSLPLSLYIYVAIHALASTMPVIDSGYLIASTKTVISAPCFLSAAIYI
jgi:hypothetical protein